MKCNRCDSQIAGDEGMDYMGELLCEDCYMDALSPVKACDPLAVFTAKSMSGENATLTELQEKILAVLKETNGMEPEALADKIGISMEALQRDIATLRHMEKLTASKDGDRRILRLW